MDTGNRQQEENEMSESRARPENWPYYSALFLDGFKAGRAGSWAGNMIAAIPALMESFGMSWGEAKDSLDAWMANRGYEICEACDGTGEYEKERGGSGFAVEDVVCICGECSGTGKRVLADAIKPAPAGIEIVNLEGWGICGNCVKFNNGLEACEDPTAEGCHVFVPTEEFAEELVHRRGRSEAKVVQDIRDLSDGMIASLSNFTWPEDIEKLRAAMVRHAIRLVDLKAIKPDERWQTVWNSFKIWFDVSQSLDDEQRTWEKELVEGCADFPSGLCSAP